MTWFKVDDSLPDHPKMVRLQSLKGWEKALALWTLAGAWASKHLTDGTIPSAILARLGSSKRSADLLVESGFWEVLPSGDYLFHGWDKRNPAKKDVEAKREQTRNRVADWRRNSVTPRVTPEERNAPPVPTRPDPSRPDPLTSFEVPTAAQVQTRFRVLYLERFGAEPYMGGKTVHTFPERLIGTAQAQGVDALALLATTFARWRPKPDEDIARNAPYAAFASQFGSLSAREVRAGDGMTEEERLQAQVNAALKARDMARYESLNAELARRFGKDH